jgi:hypothetical protein
MVAERAARHKGRACVERPKRVGHGYRKFNSASFMIAINCESRRNKKIGNGEPIRKV